MVDPFQSMQGFMTQFQSFLNQPMQYMMQKRLNLPQNWMQNPQAAVQQLMNSGAMDQQTFNQLQQMSNRIMQNPMFAQMMGGQQNPQK